MTNIERLKLKLKNAATTEVKKHTPLSNNTKDISIQNESEDNNQTNPEHIILSQKVIEIDIHELQSNPFQPRTKFENIEQLASNILKHGLLQPITVYFNDKDNKYYIIAGERRSRAIKYLYQNKLITNSKYNVNLIENILTDQEKKILATLENTHRDNMTIIDLANNAASYTKNGMSYSEVGKLFDVGKTVVSRYIKISNLPSEVQDLLNSKEVKSPNKIEMLSEIENLDKQLEFANLILEDISIVQLETKIKKYLKLISNTVTEKTVLETPFDKIKPVSKILSKSKYRKLPENEKTKADEILIEIHKLQNKLSQLVTKKL